MPLGTTGQPVIQTQIRIQGNVATELKQPGHTDGSKSPGTSGQQPVFTVLQRPNTTVPQSNITILQNPGSSSSLMQKGASSQQGALSLIHKPAPTSSQQNANSSNSQKSPQPMFNQSVPNFSIIQKPNSTQAQMVLSPQVLPNTANPLGKGCMVVQSPHNKGDSNSRKTPPVSIQTYEASSQQAVTEIKFQIPPQLQKPEYVNMKSDSASVSESRGDLKNIPTTVLATEMNDNAKSVMDIVATGENLLEDLEKFAEASSKSTESSSKVTEAPMKVATSEAETRTTNVLDSSSNSESAKKLDNDSSGAKSEISKQESKDKNKDKEDSKSKDSSLLCDEKMDIDDLTPLKKAGENKNRDSNLPTDEKSDKIVSNAKSSESSTKSKDEKSDSNVSETQSKEGGKGNSKESKADENSSIKVKSEVNDSVPSSTADGSDPYDGMVWNEGVGTLEGSDLKVCYRISAVHFNMFNTLINRYARDHRISQGF